MTRGLIKTIAHSFSMGWRDAWKQKATLASLFLGYAVLTGIWASIWFMVPGEAMEKIGMSYTQIIWYFTMTELLIFSLGHMYRDVEDDIKTGQMTMFFIRPVGYVALKGAEWMGHSCLRIAVFLPPIAVLAWLVTGGVPLSFTGMVFMPLMLITGLLIWLLIQTVIGLSAAWLNSARPIWMITQKGAFVLGGMIVPITLYPDSLRLFALATPFPAILYAPASMIVDSTWFHVLSMLALQLFWIFICFIVLIFVKSRFEERLLLRGEL